jgi:flagellar hook-basal body complex protein FliE
MIANGDAVMLARTDPRHLAGVGARQAREGGDVEQDFGNLLMKALGSVNDSQLKSMNLTQRMITAPDSVDVHDVTIALAEANLAISMTKAIVDRALTAYREIINVR